MPTFETSDKVRLYFKDWGEGAPVVFLHAYGLTSDAWDYQMASLSQNGLRCIAYDRRGHGRSDHPGGGYDYDTLADDLAALISRLDLRGITLVGIELPKVVERRRSPHSRSPLKARDGRCYPSK